MAGLIMMGLIALMVIGTILTFFMSKGWKKALYTFVTFLVIIGVFHLYVDHTCGPNAKDVEIMTPQAEAISNYILKNGLPNSLAEIPDLPYRLEGCHIAIDNTNIEWCSFKTNNNYYSIHYDSLFNILEIYNTKFETGIYINFKDQGNNTYIIDKKITPYSTKNNGVCNTLRM